MFRGRCSCPSSFFYLQHLTMGTIKYILYVALFAFFSLLIHSNYRNLSDYTIWWGECYSFLVVYWCNEWSTFKLSPNAKYFSPLYWTELTYKESLYTQWWETITPFHHDLFFAFNGNIIYNKYNKNLFILSPHSKKIQVINDYKNGVFLSQLPIINQNNSTWNMTYKYLIDSNNHILYSDPRSYGTWLYESTAIWSWPYYMISSSLSPFIYDWSTVLYDGKKIESINKALSLDWYSSIWNFLKHWNHTWYQTIYLWELDSALISQSPLLLWHAWYTNSSIIVKAKIYPRNNMTEEQIIEFVKSLPAK